MRRFTGLSACWVALCCACSGEVASVGPMQQARSAGACVAGMVVSCSCAGGAQGVATCDAASRSLGACMCEAGRGGGSNIGNTPFAPDAPVVGGAPAPVVQMPQMPPPQAQAQLASGVRIAQLALYQPVKIVLMEKAAAVAERNAPVIAGKRGLLRVFVETMPGFAARQITARVTLVSPSAPMEPLTLTQSIGASSTEAELKSTLNFELPEAFVSEDLRYSVQLEEIAGAPASAQAADAQARWPMTAGEYAELGARDPGAFRVVIVPYRYQGDSSGRLPVTSEEEMENYRAYLQQMYPASEIDLSVHEPVDYDGKIGPTSGWEEWLDSHCALRQDEDPDPKVFYYGMIAPRASWKEYGGGIAGVSNLPSPAANFGRCSVGIGFAGFAFVAAHELGHALGLEHAPCGTSGGAFPYDNATLGVWGYDLLNAKLVAPDKSHDLMSYCDPPFMSDYNYNRLFERIRYLNAQFAVREQTQISYQRVLVNSRGEVSLRGRSPFTLLPGGPQETRSIALLDDRGEPVGQAAAYFFPSSLDRGGVWLIPDTGSRAARIDGLGDITLR